MSNLDKDDLMLKEEFQKGYQNIKLPDELKQAVLSEMKKEAAIQSQIPREKEDIAEQSSKPQKKSKKFIWKIGAGSAVLCAAALAFLVLRPSGISYVTPMEDGIYYDEVELKDGEIHFVKNRVAISIIPNAGHVTIGEEGADKAEAGKETSTLEEITTESGGILSYQETDPVSLPEIAEENWSKIGECMIYVTVLKTEEVRYQAVYELDGNTYQVIGTDVSQKEFIDYLYKKIKK